MGHRTLCGLKKMCGCGTQGHMVSGGFGSAGEWLDPRDFEGFSNPNHSMVLLGQARSSVHHVKQRNRGIPAILTHTNTHISTGIYIQNKYQGQPRTQVSPA